MNDLLGGLNLEGLNLEELNLEGLNLEGLNLEGEELNVLAIAEKVKGILASSDKDIEGFLKGLPFEAQHYLRRNRVTLTAMIMTFIPYLGAESEALGLAIRVLKLV